MRSFLVYPTCCVYPNVMPTVQMFDVLHRGQDNLLQKKRVRFFWILFIGIFIWEWFPVSLATSQIIQALLINSTYRNTSPPPSPACPSSAWLIRITRGSRASSVVPLVMKASVHSRCALIGRMSALVGVATAIERDQLSELMTVVAGS